MTSVRDTGNYEQWIKFFIKGIIISGNSAIETAEQLILLREKNTNLIKEQKYTKRTFETMMKIFKYIESHPMIEIGKTSKDLDLAYNTVSTAIKRFENLEILSLSKEQERNRVYVYDKYLDILRVGTEL